MNSETKQCQNCKNNFSIEPDDFSFYTKMGVPAPTFCPQCRQEHRSLFRNFKTFHKRKSDKSGKSLISMYSEKVEFPVWSHEEWWEDDWDAKDYGRDFDFSRPFFEQLLELWNDVPHYSLQNVFCSNCEYSNMAWGSKNCYLIFGCIDDEDCNYGHILWNCKDCADSIYLFKCEQCYESIDCINCNKVFYSQDSEDCADSIGLFNCRGCTNCIGCVNLYNKSYYIFNKQVSKEEYKKFISNNPLTNPESIKMILKKMNEIKAMLPHRYYFGVNNNDVTGNHVSNSKNVHYSFDIKTGEDSKFGFTLRSFKNSYDISFNPDIENSYQTLACAKSTDLISCHLCNTCSFGFYSEHCYNSHNIFGCQGLKSSEYCILNKQYSKEEYFQIKEKIIEHMKKNGEWGEWFPVYMTPFSYNESIVNEYSPKTKEQALSYGYKWDDSLPMTLNQENVEYKNLEKNPTNYDNSLLKFILKCSECSRNYKFIESEILFYKKYNLPLPDLCFNCRHQNRMSKRLDRVLYKRACMCDKDNHAHEGKCEVEFETSYAPDRPEIIYCEKCYQQEVV